MLIGSISLSRRGLETLDTIKPDDDPVCMPLVNMFNNNPDPLHHHLKIPDMVASRNVDPQELPVINYRRIHFCQSEIKRVKSIVKVFI